MPVYYDDNKAIFDFLDKIVDHDKIIIDFLAYTSYIYSDDSEEYKMLSDDDKNAYEYVISELQQNFPLIPEEECELLLSEYIELSEEDMRSTVMCQLTEILKNLEYTNN